VRLSTAKLTHDIDALFAAPFAQQALPPANALDAISVATATRTVAVILIMVSAQTDATQEAFNLYSSISRRYFWEPNCACARRRLSAAPFNSGLRRSAASNSGMLSRALPDASRANPKLL
jgi:hypothetical protein